MKIKKIEDNTIEKYREWLFKEVENAYEAKIAASGSYIQDPTDSNNIKCISTASSFLTLARAKGKLQRMIRDEDKKDS